VGEQAQGGQHFGCRLGRSGKQDEFHGRLRK
jgi:hypothetical protein